MNARVSSQLVPAALWADIRTSAARTARSEPLLQAYLHEQVQQHPHFEACAAHIVASRIGGKASEFDTLRSVALQALGDDPDLLMALADDLRAVCARDPACGSLVDALVFFKGVHALLTYRVMHWLWRKQRTALARWLQSRMSEALGVDIHPGARIGRRVMLDHATGLVVGETAVIEDDVSILHNVTLGGTGKQTGDRHPKVRSGVLIGAGAQILGNIEIGRGAKVGAGSVVVADVAPHVTVAGVPARVVGVPATSEPALDMNHDISALPDPNSRLRALP